MYAFFRGIRIVAARVNQSSAGCMEKLGCTSEGYTTPAETFDLLRENFDNTRNYSTIRGLKALANFFFDLAQNRTAGGNL